MNPYQNSFGGNIPQDVAGNKVKMSFLLFIL